ncbi:tripartite tricarboxylate transporter permease [Halobacterium noricense]|uniref:tripartite tricarboxylate transporter permease n=1 Tax=Halobacterium noricense TaxID=223182 RepID=UPI001E499AD4|nr:tripartite tricarboxylate transporter permease [Halobacterium noricense]UHH24019.1 tripartite tricarboxylate transporter permease [Halobacterium noricense]
MAAIVGPLTEAASTLLSWPTPLWVVVGLILGMIAGALPGVGSSLGMAIVLPLTLPLSPISALVLLVSMYSGAMYGGSIAAILVNVPGTGAAAATTFDGYPMSKDGRAVEALTISATSSALGGFLTVLTLIAISPILIEAVLLFGTPEYFLMAVLGLSMIGVVARGSVIKAIVAGAFGMLLTTIGIAPNSPELRYTFGSLSLYDGIDFIAALIGMFAIAEMIKLSAQRGGIAETGIELGGNVLDGVRTVLSRPVTMIKSSFIGMFIGAVPGSGATVSNFISYGEAMRSSDNPDDFGSGEPDGVIAAEASNNGTVGGSLIPTISFGIPGSGSTAVLLGGLLMHGLRPGPQLFEAELATTYTFMLALLVGNLFILFVGVTLVTRLGVLTQIDTHYIVPTVIVLSMIGGYTLRTNWMDVATVVGLGVFGYLMVKYNYSVIAFVLGVVLGPIAEENLIRSLQLSGGSYSIFVTKPLSLLIVAAILVILFGPVVKPRLERLIS